MAGVRILPAVVQFHDAEPGVLHQMSLKVQNLSKFSKSVRFHAPDSKVKDLLHLSKSQSVTIFSGNRCQALLKAVKALYILGPVWKV